MPSVCHYLTDSYIPKFNLSVYNYPHIHTKNGNLCMEVCSNGGHGQWMKSVNITELKCPVYSTTRLSELLPRRAHNKLYFSKWGTRETTQSCFHEDHSFLTLWYEFVNVGLYLFPTNRRTYTTRYVVSD